MYLKKYNYITIRNYVYYVRDRLIRLRRRSNVVICKIRLNL